MGQVHTKSLNKLFNTFISLFIFRGEGRKRGEKHQYVKHQYVVASCLPPTGDLACNPGMCPDLE